MVGTHPGPEVRVEDKIRALESVLQSETFARSERLKSLLRFLCEAEIDGRQCELNEYSIGTKALGRPKDFAPLEDSSVRSRAYELRHKLDKYYALEAPSAHIHIELRKGSYVPRFCAVQPEFEAAAHDPARRQQMPAPQSDSPISPEPPAQRPTLRRSATLTVVLAFTAGAVVVFAALAVWSAIVKPGTPVPATNLQAGGVTPWTPELEALWQPFLESRAPLMVAFETRFFVEMGPLVVRDWHVNSLGGVESSEPLMQVQRLFGLRQLYASGNYTDVGTPEAMFYLTRLLSNRVAMSVKSSHDITAAELRDGNLILVGKPWLDSQIERVLAAADLVDTNGRIENRHPVAGEQAIYSDHQDKTDPDGLSEKHAVITMMPNPTGGKRILALTASGSEHPSALAEYMTNAESVRDLVRHLRTTPGGMPNYYQILVRAKFKGKSLIRAEYVTHRPLTAR